jgi:hypothetical protein
MTLDELLEAVALVDGWLDSDMSPEYEAQPLAHDWARITKVCEEAGEVWKALSQSTGENPRKGVCATEVDLLGELADTACGAIFAIQHRTKDATRTWMIIAAAASKARGRAAAAIAAAMVVHDHDGVKRETGPPSGRG